jgi:SnoaL-like domain
MALDRSPELEQAHHDLMSAYEKRDTDAMRRRLSGHSAFAMRGTAPEEVTTQRDEAIQLIAQSREDFPTITTTHLEAYADGDLGYVYAEGSFKADDGTEYPSRSLVIAHRRMANGDSCTASTPFPFPTRCWRPTPRSQIPPPQRRSAQHT